MRQIIIITLCAATLTACADATYQAAPVDAVETSNLGAPK